MARETKVGLLIALGVILLIGVIISDHLAVSRPQEAQAGNAAAVARFAPAAQQGIQPGQQTTEQPTPTSTDNVRGLPESAPRLIAPDRFAEPTLGPPSRQRPDVQAADAGSILADLPSPPPAWRQVQPTVNTDAPNPTTAIRGLPDAMRAEAELAIAPAPVRQAGSEFLHDVLRGDTLGSVAIKYYHDAAYADSLLAANPDALDADGKLTPGSRLIIPNRAGHIDPPTPQVARQTTILDRSAPDDSIANEPPTALMSTGLFVPITGINAAGDAPGTLAPITAHADAQRSEASGQTITVQAGDSLSKLAERHLGTQARYLELYEANRDVLASPDKVVVGMELKLPTDASASQKIENPESEIQNPSAPPARPAAKTYTVKTGDNLSRIAEVTLGSRDRWKELYEANRDRLDTPDTVKVGQELRIPG